VNGLKISCAGERGAVQGVCGQRRTDQHHERGGGRALQHQAPPRHALRRHCSRRWLRANCRPRPLGARPPNVQRYRCSYSCLPTQAFSCINIGHFSQTHIFEEHHLRHSVHVERARLCPTPSAILFILLFESCWRHGLPHNVQGHK
jgi:hypothetical protein